MIQKKIPPVLLIIFNRPDIAKTLFERIREIKPPKLYFAADGPRKHKEGEVQKCMETRAIIDSIDWDCEIHKNFSEKNLGCKTRVSTAIDWFFENEESGIILEDDCLPDVSFFDFCSELLEKYKDDERVGMISGNNFQFGKIKNKYSYYFSKYTHTWGWATWKRAWNKFDISLTNYPENKDKALAVLRNKKSKLYWDMIFSDIYTGRMDEMGLSVWDYQWTYASFLNNFVSIMPSVNLVSNIGFGESISTHTKRKSKFSFMETHTMKFPIVHPDQIIADEKSDAIVQKDNYPFFRFLISRFLRKVKILK